MDDLKDYIDAHSNKIDHNLTFNEYFYKLLNEKKLTTPEVYNSVFMSRQSFSKIINGQVKPTLKSAIKIAIGLRCDNQECKLLLKKLDYTLASHSKFNLCLRYCFDNHIYNLNEINNLLYQACKQTLDE